MPDLIEKKLKFNIHWLSKILTTRVIQIGL